MQLMRGITKQLACQRSMSVAKRCFDSNARMLQVNMRCNLPQYPYIACLALQELGSAMWCRSIHVLWVLPGTDDGLICPLQMSCMQKSFSTEERQKQHAHKHGSKKAHKAAKVVSSTALTPGTPFMHDVCVSCSYYVCARLAQRKWQNVSCSLMLHIPPSAERHQAKVLCAFVLWQSGVGCQQPVTVQYPCMSLAASCLSSLLCQKSALQVLETCATCQKH
eukprot:GHRR01013792.1.p1 GENE.GHRR01013792.1~~GHRR01013792.1.p1  ORF type:complete len:221 (+),score=35.96 GHRR01013792.1:812-1474(+)